MTAHYLIDMFGNPLSSSAIVDVREPTNGQSLANGCFIVRIPDFIQVQNPTDLNDLLTKKYQGLLAFYAGFTHIAYDDLMDPLSLNLAYAGTGGFFGERNTIALSPGASIQSVVIPLASTPTVAVITWEVFRYLNADPKADRLQRTYWERPSTGSFTTCSVSFDGGVHFEATTDGAVHNIPLAYQGSSFIIRLTNSSSDIQHIGSWAVIY